MVVVVAGGVGGLVVVVVVVVSLLRLIVDECHSCIDVVTSGVISAVDVGPSVVT